MNFPALYPGDGATTALFRALSAVGGMGVVHAENGDVIGRLSGELIAAGRGDYRHADDSRPAWVEAEAVSRAIALAAARGGALRPPRHLGGRRRRDRRCSCRRRGDLRGNVPQLPASSASTTSRIAPTARTGATSRRCVRPSTGMRSGAALAGGTIDHVSTDDYTNDLDNRNAVGLSLPTPPAGHNGIETRLAVLYTEAVASAVSHEPLRRSGHCPYCPTARALASQGLAGGREPMRTWWCSTQRLAGTSDQAGCTPPTTASGTATALPAVPHDHPEG